MFSLSRQTVFNIFKQANNEERLELKPTSGRPRLISERAERTILRKIDKNPQVSLRTIVNELKEESGVVVSHETVRQLLNRNTFTSRYARRKPLLSMVNIQKRLLFAETHL